MGIIDQALFGRPLGGPAPEPQALERGCFTLFSVDGSTTYCTTIERTEFSNDTGTVVAGFEPLDNTTLVVDPLVEIHISGVTQFSDNVEYPPPGGTKKTISASGPASPGDPVSVLSTTDAFQGGEVLLETTLPETINIDDVNVISCAANPDRIGEGESTTFTATVENVGSIEAVAQVRWFILDEFGNRVAPDGAFDEIIVPDGGTAAAESDPVSWSDAKSIEEGTVSVEGEVVQVF